MMNDTVKILQIIPADGWYARFDANGTDFERLISWALVEDTQSGERWVTGLVYFDSIDFAENGTHLVIYRHETELSEDERTYIEHQRVKFARPVKAY